MEQCLFRRLSVFVECSTGNTLTVEALKRFIDILSRLGYNELYLGLTDAYKIEGEPYFNYMRGGYTVSDLQEIDAFAKERGIEVIANIQTLGHLHYVRRHEAYRDLFDTDHILLAGDERVYRLVDRMLDTISRGLTSRRIHIGLDETIGIGLGKYRDLHGLEDGGAILLRHLQRVDRMAKKYGYTCEIWGDMLSYNKKSALTTEQVKAMIPPDVETVYWEYHQTDVEKISGIIEDFKRSAAHPAYAGNIYKEVGFGPCNGYSIPCLKAQMEAASRQGLEHFIITLWSDGGAQCSVFSVLPGLFAASEFAHGRMRAGDEPDKKRFRELFGVDHDDMISLDLLNNPFGKTGHDLSSRAFWIMFEDLLVGNRFLLLSEGTAERYAAIAARFRSIDAGPYDYIFRMSAELAEILSLRIRLFGRLRPAYDAGDREALRSVAEEDLPRLIEKTQAFTETFVTYWKHDNMAFGLEKNLLLLGGQAARYRYIIRSLIEYLERGVPVEELEVRLLPPTLPGSETTEDTCREMDYRKLLSYCEI